MAAQKHSIETKHDLAAELHRVYEEAEKPADRIRALSAIADLRGLKATKGLENLRHLQPHELDALVREVVIPAVGPYLEGGSDGD